MSDDFGDSDSEYFGVTLNRNKDGRVILAGGVIAAKAGDHVRYLDENGHEWQREEARRHFKKGDILTIERISVGRDYSKYYFVGIPSDWNTVMFERVAEENGAPVGSSAPLHAGRAESGVASPQTASHPSRPALEASSNPSWSRELVKEIAMDVGKDVCGYIEWMYPKAVEATSSTFLLSLRNSIHNQIMAALDGPTDEVSIRERLAARKTWRRKFKALWKKGREMPERAWESGAVHEMGASGAEGDQATNHPESTSIAPAHGSGFVVTVNGDLGRLEDAIRSLRSLPGTGG